MLSSFVAKGWKYEISQTKVGKELLKLCVQKVCDRWGHHFSVSSENKVNPSCIKIALRRIPEKTIWGEMIALAFFFSSGT